MLKALSLAAALVLVLTAQGFAQNRNTSTQTAPAAKTTTTTTRSNTQQETPATETTTTRTRRASTGSNTQTGAKDPSAEGVIAAFDNLIEGIRRADVNAVTAVYWNSPQLILFNNNGTVTKGWEQMRKNRESSYPELKDVKIEVRDRRVQMLGRDGAVVSFLWTQSQTVGGTPETGTGRTTLVYRHIGTAWKIVHSHTSPESPDLSRVLPSERTTPTPAPTPTPKVRPE